MWTTKYCSLSIMVTILFCLPPWAYTLELFFVLLYWILLIQVRIGRTDFIVVYILSHIACKTGPLFSPLSRNLVSILLRVPHEYKLKLLLMECHFLFIIWLQWILYGEKLNHWVLSLHISLFTLYVRWVLDFIISFFTSFLCMYLSFSKLTVLFPP